MMTKTILMIVLMMTIEHDLESGGLDLRTVVGDDDDDDPYDRAVVGDDDDDRA